MTASEADVAGIGPLLEAGGPGLRSDLERVEVGLSEVFDGFAPSIAGPARATIAAGGKRLRPLLVLLAADRSATQSPLGKSLLRAAISVELIHAATLVHDDVLDGADLRRGQPTVVAASGRAMATAAGDLLFSRAFAVLARNGDRAQLRVLSRASSALAQGELLQREDAWNPRVTLERYLLRCECKTARLFEAACRLGVLSAAHPAPMRADPGTSAEVCALADELGSFGMRIGLAFQILDDVLDVSGPTERTGKPRGADLLDGTVTLPLIMARDRDPSLEALDPRSITSATDAAEVCRRIGATGALDAAREMAWSMVTEAKAGLGSAVKLKRRATLELVADSVVARYA